ncbi:MAG: 1,2-phenylacetyl-CoA epoxidase subunit PaaC [Bacteroidia bacterium]
MNHHIDYVLRLADNALILGQRLGEWCGHGPVLEQDIALTNISLDLIGQARSFYQYVAELDGQGKSEDDYAFLRDAWDFCNVLLVELPKGHFGTTIVRQFLYDAYSFYFYTALKNSSDTQLAAIAEKSLKEVNYHLRWSSEWVIRLGDGTAESHEKVQTALNDLWTYTGEMFMMNDTDKIMLDLGIGVDLEDVQALWQLKVKEVLTQATLTQPNPNMWMQRGGKEGKHSEHLGFILAEMQFLQRAYPNAKW